MEIRVEHGGNEPKVRGDRRLQRQEVEHPAFGLQVRSVDLIVSGDDPVGEDRVAPSQRLERIGQRSLCQLSHPRQLHNQRVHLVVKAAASCLHLRPPPRHPPR